MYKKLLFTGCLVCLITFQGFSQNGKLGKGKESLKKTPTSRTSSVSKKSKRNTRTSNNGDRNLFQTLFINIIGGAAMYTVYGAVIESPWEFKGRMHDAEISHYPFEKPVHGNFIYTNSTNYNITRFDIYNRFLRENKNLYGNNLGFDFRFFKRFSLNADFVTFRENFNGKKDNYNMYSGLLKYHRIRTQRFDAWFGLGATYVANNVNETGFTFGFGGEWFVKKPISLLFSHRTTSINNEKINNTKLLLKYHIKNYRVASGYEHYRIGVSKISAFSFGVEASF